MDSNLDEVSVYGEHSSCLELDYSAEFSDDDFQQKISSLEAQLARLKTSVEKTRTRKMYTGPCNFVKTAAQPPCSTCGKLGHSKTN